MKPLLIITLFLSGVFFSCQKSTIDEQLPPDADPADTLLQAILTVDTLHPHTNLVLDEFVYDNQKRVTEIKSMVFDSTNGSITIHEQYSTIFHYNGAEKQPFKTFGHSNLVYQDWETYHFYDGNKRLVLDSLGDPSGSFVLSRHIHAPGRIDVYVTYVEEDGSVPYAYADSFYVAGNNITNAFLTETITQAEEDVFELTYDDKASPLSKLNIAASIGVYGFFAYSKFPVLGPGYSKNNAIKYESTSTQYGINITREFKYTYNSNNLPIQGIFIHHANGVLQDDEGLKVFFKYTH